MIDFLRSHSELWATAAACEGGEAGLLDDVSPAHAAGLAALAALAAEPPARPPGARLLPLLHARRGLSRALAAAAPGGGARALDAVLDAGRFWLITDALIERVEEDAALRALYGGSGGGGGGGSGAAAGPAGEPPDSPAAAALDLSRLPPGRTRAAADAELAAAERALAVALGDFAAVSAPVVVGGGRASAAAPADSVPYRIDERRRAARVPSRSAAGAPGLRAGLLNAARVPPALLLVPAAPSGAPVPVDTFELGRMLALAGSAAAADDAPAAAGDGAAGPRGAPRPPPPPPAAAPDAAPWRHARLAARLAAAAGDVGLLSRLRRARAEVEPEAWAAAAGGADAARALEWLDAARVPRGGLGGALAAALRAGAPDAARLVLSRGGRRARTRVQPSFLLAAAAGGSVRCLELVAAAAETDEGGPVGGGSDDGWNGGSSGGGDAAEAIVVDEESDRDRSLRRVLAASMFEAARAGHGEALAWLAARYGGGSDDGGGGGSGRGGDDGDSRGGGGQSRDVFRLARSRGGAVGGDDDAGVAAEDADAAAAWAVANGDVPSARVLLAATRGSSWWRREAHRVAAANGRVEMLEWLSGAAAGGPALPVHRGTCVSAADGGSVPALAWARARGCAWAESVPAAAARGGNLDALLFALRGGCRCDTHVVAEAARGGHAGVVAAARAEGAPWSEEAVRAAAAGGHVELVRWLVERGCPYNRGAVERAAERRGDKRLLAWLAAQGD